MNRTKGYQAVQHQTTDQGGILILLYDGTIREIRRARKALNNGKSAAIHLLNANMGVVEMDRTLNFNAGPELAESLHQVYLHIIWKLSEALDDGKVEHLAGPEKLLLELRQAWSEAATLERQQKRAAS